jgi:hypothetical protein
MKAMCFSSVESAAGVTGRDRSSANGRACCRRIPFGLETTGVGAYALVAREHALHVNREAS